MAIDRNAVAARIEVIADALSLPDQDWLALAQDDERIIDFARRHGQSLDWIFEGDVRSMICRRAHGRALSLDQEAADLEAHAVCCDAIIRSDSQDLKTIRGALINMHDHLTRQARRLRRAASQ